MIQKRLGLLVFLTILLAGFYFRYIGISQNLSFWNDEIHAALFSRGVLEFGKPVNTVGVGTGIYQGLFYYVTALSFSLFGVTEFAGRLPSVLAGTGLIALVYVVTKKMLGEREALVAAFLTAFSQIQLAWSTQLRPYIWLEIFTLLTVYFLYRYLKEKSFLNENILCAAGSAIFASLFHGTGLINLALLALVIIYRCVKEKKYRLLLLAAIPLVIGSIIFYFSLTDHNRTAIMSILSPKLNLLHYRVFLQANYWWLIAGAAVGAVLLFRQKKELSLMLSVSTAVIFAFAILIVNAGYVRYSLPAFPLLYILFSFGLVTISTLIARRLTKTTVAQSIIIILLIICVMKIPLAMRKVLLQPHYYYSINGDMRENPIVDYKTAFAKIQSMTKGKSDVIVMDAWNDRVPWFMPDQKYIFLIKEKFDVDPIYKVPLVGTISEFEKVKKQYPYGVVIVENWESLTPHDLQQHIRNTLKKELNVDNLPYNEADKWSITVYSWGFKT